MELLAIPLGHQKTVAKWLVISQTRRTRKIAALKVRNPLGAKAPVELSAPHMWVYVSKIFRVQRRMAT